MCGVVRRPGSLEKAGRKGPGFDSHRGAKHILPDVDDNKDDEHEEACRDGEDNKDYKDNEENKDDKEDDKK